MEWKVVPAQKSFNSFKKIILKKKKKNHKTNGAKIEKENTLGTSPKAGAYRAFPQNKHTEDQG